MTARKTSDASSWAEVVPQLDEAMACLPEDLRDLLVRHFLRGESQSELAAELNTSAATLSRRMKTAVEISAANRTGARAEWGYRR